MKIKLIDKELNVFEVNMEGNNIDKKLPKGLYNYRIYYNCVICNKEYNKYFTYNNNWICKSCKTKNMWRNNEYKEKHICSLKETLKDPIKRQKRTELNYKMWSNIDYKNKMKNIFNSAEYQLKHTLSRLDKHNLQENKILTDKNVKLDFKNNKCESAAEMAFVNLCKKNNWEIERCQLRILYYNTIKKRNSYYNPDFIIKKNNKITICEIKGCYIKDINNNTKTKGGKASIKIIVDEKMKQLRKYCNNKGFNCELITFDNFEFRKEYNNLVKEIRDKVCKG